MVLEDLGVELLGLPLGFGAELAVEHVHAELVLPQGGAAPSLTHIEPHQGAMHDLLERIEGQHSSGREDRRLALLRLDVVSE